MDNLCILRGMPKTRRRKPVGQYRIVFAENLEAHLKVLYPAHPSDRIDRPAMFVAEHPGIVSKSTLNRWLRGESAANLDHIEIMAKVLQTTPRALVTPTETAAPVQMPVILPRTGRQQQSEQDFPAE